MKEEFAKLLGDALQRTLDEDMADLSTEMAVGRAYKSGSKITPAFEHVDVFQRQEYNNRTRKARQVGKTDLEMNLIQPNDPSKPRVMVVLPNE